jgi:hypothetical protein
LTNPQSWNAYSYALNNPLALVDPSGLDLFGPGGGDGCEDDPFCGGGGWPPIGWGPGAQSTPPPPRPVPVTVSPSNDPNATGVYAQGQFGSWPNDGETLGLPARMTIPGPFGLGLPNPWILSACSASDPNCVAPPQIALYSGVDLINESWLLRKLFGSGGNRPSSPFKTRLFGTHWCGPGGAGPTVNRLDQACQAHDFCYDAHDFTAFSNYDPMLVVSPAKLNALQSCNQSLCNASRTSARGNGGSRLVDGYFTSVVPVGACR